MPDGQHLVVSINNGRLFIVRCFNISVIKGCSLLASVSRNFSGDVLCASVKNKYGLIGRMPRRLDETVVSLLTGGGGIYSYCHWLFDVIPRLLSEECPVVYRNYKPFVPDNRQPFHLTSL